VEAFAAGILAIQHGGEGCEEVFDIAQEQILFVAIVNVEGGAADLGAIEHVFMFTFSWTI